MAQDHRHLSAQNRILYLRTIDAYWINLGWCCHQHQYGDYRARDYWIRISGSYHGVRITSKVAGCLFHIS